MHTISNFKRWNTKVTRAQISRNIQEAWKVTPGNLVEKTNQES